MKKLIIFLMTLTLCMTLFIACENGAEEITTDEKNTFIPDETDSSDYELDNTETESNSSGTSSETDTSADETTSITDNIESTVETASSTTAENVTAANTETSAETASETDSETDAETTSETTSETTGETTEIVTAIQTNTEITTETRSETNSETTVESETVTETGSETAAETESTEETSETVTEETTSEAPKSLAVFEFGANGEAKHSDSRTLMDDTSSSFTVNKHTLKFTKYELVYLKSRDAMGNSALKLGKTDTTASFELLIPENVDQVVIRVAKYKKENSKVIVNGIEHTLTKNSDDGEYDEIVIDTSSNKTITFETHKTQRRCMIDSIEFIG